MSGALPQDGIVTFVYADWIARFPEFASVPAPLAQLYFNDATLICDNTPASIVGMDENGYPRTQMLYLLTAHVAKLSGWGPGSTQGGGGTGSPSGPGVIGQITSASEGSVSVSVAQLAGASASYLASWLSQTQYGAAYYAMTSAYRMAAYHPGWQPYLGVGQPYLGIGQPYVATGGRYFGARRRR